MKKYKIILTGLVVLLPMFAGLILWKNLPDMIATHFGFNNVPNGWSSKGFTVFGMPLILLAAQIICLFATLNDPKKKNIGTGMMNFVIWIVPAISVVVGLMIYLTAFKINVNVGVIISLLIGALFVSMGFAIMKVKQNYTVGIKLPWTLASEENWNRTHHFAGRVWIICGAVFAANIFFPFKWIAFVAMAVMIILPIIYSFVLYKKGV
ncbi:MAG: SdpI family protein [Bacillota bacterium]|nr:SdpI family protein [Bacillota bacterium]